MFVEAAEAELWSEAEQRSWSSRSNCGMEWNVKPGSGVAECNGKRGKSKLLIS